MANGTRNMIVLVISSHCGWFVNYKEFVFGGGLEGNTKGFVHRNEWENNIIR